MTAFINYLAVITICWGGGVNVFLKHARFTDVKPIFSGLAVSVFPLRSLDFFWKARKNVSVLPSHNVTNLPIHISNHNTLFTSSVGSIEVIFVDAIYIACYKS